MLITSDRQNPSRVVPISRDIARKTGRGGEARRILIVEDNELNKKLLRDLLAAHGYETLETSDGLDAINLARDGQPDLILMDIQLPDVSGLEVTRWLRDDDRTKRIPIIAVTAFAMQGDERRALDSGCDAYLSKPIMIRHLLQTVADHLPRRPN
jgi:two-component system cell cycle response regulator DivK